MKLMLLGVQTKMVGFKLFHKETLTADGRFL